MRGPTSFFISLWCFCGFTAAITPPQFIFGGGGGKQIGDACSDLTGILIGQHGMLLPIDHNKPQIGTFCNRYWVQKAFYQPGGPVFIWHAGEDRGEKSLENIASNGKTKDENLSVFETFLQSFGGLGIVLEHRYYGKSIPGNVKIKDKRDIDFQYLTIDLALADVDAFVRNFKHKDYPKVDFSPENTPWISVGGSYSGMIAAMMRKKYYKTIFAAYASSAPIQAAVEMPGYYEQVYEGINAFSPACAADLKAAIKEIDKRLKDPQQRRATKESLLGCQKEEVDDGTFASDMSDMFNDFQDTGMDEPTSTLRKLCEYLRLHPDTKQPVDSKGWAAQYKPDFVVKQLQAGTALKEAVDAKKKGYGTCGKKSTWPQITVPRWWGRNREELDYISWTWQRCNELGYFYVANLGANQIVLSAMNVTYQQKYCYDQFTQTTGQAILAKKPTADAINAVYGGWNTRPSRTFWTAGQFDPWTALSPFSEQAPNKVIEQKIPSCQLVSSPKNPLFGYQLPAAEHCFDFQKSVAGTKTSIALFTDALTTWIACRKAGTIKD
jgi:hypothetical protein